MTDTPKEPKTGTTTHTVKVNVGTLDAAGWAQHKADAKAFTDDVALIEALATEATYTVSSARSVIDLCAFALSYADGTERVVPQVKVVLDMLSDHLETKLNGELTRLDLGVTKIARGLKAKGVVLWP